jgi:alpha-D-xyloside xylohydrolase
VNQGTFLALTSSERLRLPGNPVAVRPVAGAVVIDLPFAAYTAGERGSLHREDSAPVVQSLRVRAYGRGMLRLTLDLDGSLEENTPMLNPDTIPAQRDLDVRVIETGFEIVDASGALRGRIHCAPIPLDHWSDLLPAREKQFEVVWLPDGITSVPFKSYDQFAHGVTDSIPLGYVEEGGKPKRTLFSLQADSDECFAGTGERFAKMDLSGRTLTLQNEDGLGVNSRRTYKNVPFYLSSRPYGAFIHTSSTLDLSLAERSTRSVQGSVADGALDMFLIGGGGVREILFQYCCLTGFAPHLPLWSYGIWMSRMSYFSAEEIKGIARRLRAGDFPCDVLHIDTGWFARDWLCEWTFSPERFPDPAGFMKELKADGYRVTLWQTPDISGQSSIAPVAQEKGFLPKAGQAAEAGSDFSMQQICGPIDFTNPAACAWYQNDLLTPLLKMGAAAIKTDFGETIDMKATYHSLPAGKLRNRYALLYQRAAFEATHAVYGDNETLIWARAGWAGCQRYPLHWGGDAECSWEGMAGTLRGGLHLGLSGFTYWSHDVPGFHGTPDFMNSRPSNHLYVRWTQFAVFTSHIRYHGTGPREPYLFPEVADIVRDWWKLRYQLIPYIKEESEASAARGLPMLRAMMLEDESDPTCWHLDDQYMFGDAFLVAPVMNDRGIRHVYLPAGQWVCFWSGRVYQGKQWLLKQEYPLHQMPVFVKAGTEFPIHRTPVSCTDEMKLDTVERITVDEHFKGMALKPRTMST